MGAFLAQDLRALRPLLRPDAGAVLLPHRSCGGRTASSAAAAVLKIIIYTLVGSLLMLVGAIATGVLSRPGRRRTTTFVAQRAAAAPRVRRLAEAGSSWFFALAFLIKMPSFPFHGWMPDGYRQMPIAPLARLHGGPLEGRRLRLPADRAAAVPRRRGRVPGAAAAASRSPRSSTARRWRSPRRTRGWSLGYSSVAQLGFIVARDLRARRAAAPTARCCSRSTTRSSSVAADLHRRAARRARRRQRGPARHGRHRDARAGARGASSSC